MRFGTFYEHQLPRPWTDERNDRVLLEEALEQVEVADRCGFDYVWEVEHHFLEEYSHSSAPEVFLAAASQRSKQIRLGHGIVNMLPGVNHPARVAERIATLDLISGGRVDWGTGQSSARMELEGFDIDPNRKRDMWIEGTRECARMMSTDPYPGFEGEFFRMPCRNVLPKPIQSPHPPLWVACSNRETILTAARFGMGALTFAFTDPKEAKHWVDDYYSTFKNDCVPIGQAVNPNIAMVSGFSVHEDADEAVARGLDGFRFFQYALGHFYIFGTHQPGRTNIWQGYEDFDLQMGMIDGTETCIGTPDMIRKTCRTFEDAGVDQLIFIQQGGNNRHDHILDALELFSQAVMPEFKDRHAERERAKMAELEPFIEQAFARKREQEGEPDRAFEPPHYPSYGRSIAAGIDSRETGNIHDNPARVF